MSGSRPLWFGWRDRSIEKEPEELMKRIEKALGVEIERVILDFKDVVAFSSEAMVLLSRKGLLQKEEGKPWLAINVPDHQ